jgi:hypothetical protein
VCDASETGASDEVIRRHDTCGRPGRSPLQTRRRRCTTRDGPCFLALATSPARSRGDDLCQRVDYLAIAKRTSAWSDDGLIELRFRHRYLISSRLGTFADADGRLLDRCFPGHPIILLTRLLNCTLVNNGHGPHAALVTGDESLFNNEQREWLIARGEPVAAIFLRSPCRQRLRPVSRSRT